MYDPRHVIRDIAVIALVLILGAGISIGVYRLAMPEDEKSAGISIDWEGRLRDVIRRQIERESTVIRKAEVTRAMDVIMQRFTPAATNLPHAPEIIVIDTPVVNAYAFPGGLIVVTSGLLRDASSAEEAAAVIAHELGHVAHRDPLSLIIRQTGLSVLFAVASGGNTTVIHDIIRQAVNSHYSKQQETRADEYSCSLLTASGIDPRHIAVFFRKIQTKHRQNSEKLLEPLATHPATSRRIAHAEQWAKKFRGPERRLPIAWGMVRSRLPSAFDR